MQEDYSIFPEQQTTYAGFWERFGAAFLDGLILIPVVYGLNYLMTGSIVGETVSQTSEGGITFSTQYYVSQLISLIVGWLYFAIQESSVHQATLGKRGLGLKVTNLQGGKLSFGQATGRHFGKYLSAVILFIGYLMMVWDSKKQTLHDKMAGALVIRKKE
jgi:uncharacterized RDD family membrane protein YckC